ncbi:murein transglycosylase A [Roseibium sp.]|uniref:murein transglycosylase A n=1 Tax=Roseibium sp. TaxID=1936156 RepID=UPI003D0D2485
MGRGRPIKRWPPAFPLAASLKGAVLAAPLFFSGAAFAMQQDPHLPDTLEQTAFADLKGWAEDDHAAALAGFLRFCRNPASDKGGMSADDFRHLCQLAEDSAGGSSTDARRFFETRFTPFKFAGNGFVTGYFEPEVAASRQRTGTYRVPLLKKPEGLEPAAATNRPANWPADLSHGRRIGGTLKEMPDRGAIMDGALDGEGLELAYLADPVDAFFIHVQGSARLRLSDGSVMRVGYAGKTGHPYTGIGRLLVERGEGSPEDFTMAGLRKWLKDHPDRRDALLRQNRSFIFFREVTETAPDEGPVGAAGLPLVAGRSLAVDADHIPYGAMVFVSAGFSDWQHGNKTFARLMVADDTGSAIKGPARGDIFAGSGEKAGAIAGEIRHSAEFTVLVPNVAVGNPAVPTD